MISQPNKFVHSTRYAAAKQYMPASEVDAAEHAVERKSREVLLPYIAAAKVREWVSSLRAQKHVFT